MLGFFVVVFSGEIESCGGGYWWRAKPPAAAVAPSEELAKEYMGYLDREVGSSSPRDFGKFKNVNGQDIEGGGVLLSLSWEDRSWKVYLAPQVFESQKPIEEAIEFLLGTYKRLENKYVIESDLPKNIVESPVQLQQLDQLMDGITACKNQIQNLEQKLKESEDEKFRQERVILAEYQRKSDEIKQSAGSSYEQKANSESFSQKNKDLKESYEQKLIEISCQKEYVKARESDLKCKVCSLLNTARMTDDDLKQLTMIIPEIFNLPKAVWDKWPDLIRQYWITKFMELDVERKKQFLAEWKFSPARSNRIAEAYPNLSEGDRDVLFDCLPKKFCL